MFKRIVEFACVVTLLLVMLGAYVRLTDAGLGCPDWPGCYGQLTPKQAAREISVAVAAQGGEHGPVSMGKAWREMLHRYLASFLGLVIVVIAGMAIVHRKRLNQPLLLPIALVGVVIMQGMFGKWTVTMNLTPIIVTGHLVGGLTTFALLTWLWSRQQAPRAYVDPEPLAQLRPLALIAIVLLAIQIFLGGWTSTNYAALACSDLPSCNNGQWWPDPNFSDGFSLNRELGRTTTGAIINSSALVAIHLVHRIGAVIVFLYLGWLSGKVATAGERSLGRLLGAALIVQVLLGLSNIWFKLPLWVSVFHNGGAAVLLAVLVVINYRISHAARRV
jgi:heme a synthase